MIIWLIFVVLIFIALAFILPPLWQSSEQTQRDSHHGRTEANVGVYRDQLSELEMDLRNGIVAPEQYQQDRDEIERRLLEDVSLSEPTTRPSGGDKRRLAFALALAFPLVAVSFYLAVGNPKAISPEAAVTPAVAGTGTNEFSQQRIEANVASLAKRLADNPSDGPGWVMLARSYSSMEKYREADDAFAKATALVTNDADLWAEYAFANAMANGRQLQGKPLELVNKALKLDPENLKGLELAGSAAFQAKDYKQAIEYWQRLLSKVPADSEVAESVKQRLEEAKSLAKPK